MSQDNGFSKSQRDYERQEPPEPRMINCPDCGGQGCQECGDSGYIEESAEDREAERGDRQREEQKNKDMGL